MQQQQQQPVAEDVEKVYKQIFYCAFAGVYGSGSECNKLAKRIYKQIIQYLEQKDPRYPCLFEEKDRKEILTNLRKASPQSEQGRCSLKIKFYCQYGCAVVMKKQKKQSSISVNIVTPESYSYELNIEDQQFQFTSPKGELLIYNPTVTDYQIDLEEFAAQLEGNIEQQLKTVSLKQIQAQNSKEGDSLNEKSVRSIEQAVKRALAKNDKFNKKKSLTRLNSSAEKIDDPQLSQQIDEKSLKSITNNYKCSKSANSAWFVTVSVVRMLLVDKRGPRQSLKKAEKLMIGFRSYIFERYAQNLSLSSQDQDKNSTVGKLKKCLDELIYEYKRKVSRYTKKIEPFQKAISRIYEKIVKVMGGHLLTSRIKSEAPQNQDFTIEQKKIPKFVMLEPTDEKKNREFQPVQIDQFPLSVNKRYPFEQLLDILEEVTSQQKMEGRQKMKDSQKQQMESSVNQWVLLVEKVFFNYADQLDVKKVKDYQEDSNQEQNEDEDEEQEEDDVIDVIDLGIHMREIEVQFGASNLCKIVMAYEKVVLGNLKHFGMRMEGQAKSHIQLIKTIASAIAFESVKLNREKRKSELSKYRIPISIKRLYSMFVSHSYEARRAMKKLLKYEEKRKNLQKLFLMDGTDKSFADFARDVAEDTRSAHVWVQAMNRLHQEQKKTLEKDIKLNQLRHRIDHSSQYGLFDPKWKSLSTNLYIDLPLRQYPTDDPWLFAFLNNIPPDVLGLIKIVMLAQNPKQNVNPSPPNSFSINKTVSKIQYEELPIQIYCEQKKIMNKKHISTENFTIQQLGETQPNLKTMIKLGESSFAGGINEQMFHVFDKNQELNKFLKAPQDQKDKQRQHFLYAHLTRKPKEIEVQDFLAIGNVRSAEQTQMMVLCLNILERKIISDSYNQEKSLFPENVILQTAGQLSTYNAKTEKYFRRIYNLISKYLSIWVFSDTGFCPTLAPMIGYLMQELIDDELVDEEEEKMIRQVPFQLAKKCWEEFERGEKQMDEGQSSNIQWDQRFICTAAILCFRQITLKESDQEEILFFTKLLFQHRNCRIFSDREKKPENKRPFEKQLQFGIEKAINRNIEVVCNFLEKNQRFLNEIIKTYDRGFNNAIKWSRYNTYEFQSQQSEKLNLIYQLDIYRGCIFKNGKQLTALDKKIKQSKLFKQIFGEHREFQVYPSTVKNYVRTKNNVNLHFKISEKNQQIFFEFAEDGSEIRYIVSYGQNEEIWRLIQTEKLAKSDCMFPKLFIDLQFAWLCEEKNCVVFRRKRFEQIYNIGLVLHLTKAPKQFLIKTAFLVVYNNGYENQDLNEICDPENDKFEKVILRSKNQKLLDFKPYKYLSKFENEHHIVELFNTKTNDTFFYLYRHQMRFKLDKNKLRSESHFGYCLEHSFFEDKSCLFNYFPCLVLRKDSDDQMILNSHNHIVIVSDGDVEKNGKIRFSNSADKYINSFRYNIHDFFKDLRGLDRSSQLHMAAIMLSINNNMRIQSLEMTPLQYALYLIRTCLTNRPFNKKQLKKLKNVMKFNIHETFLLLEALWHASTKVENILSFKQTFEETFKETDNLKREINRIFGEKKQVLLKLRTLYQKKVEEQTINFHEQVNSDLLKSIGFQIKSVKHKPHNSESDQSEFQVQQFWKGIEPYRGTEIDEKSKEIKEIVKDLNAQFSDLDIWKTMKEDQINNDQESTELPKEIGTHALNFNKNLMMEEMMNQLKESFITYTKQKQKFKSISKKLNEEGRAKQKQIVTQLKIKCKNCLQLIDELLKGVKKANSQHPDVITGFRPTLSEAFFTSNLCEGDRIFAYFPSISESTASELKQIIKIWIEMKTRLASLERVEILLNNEKIDVVALMREILSPRQEIRKKNYWLCYEAEMKIQIWKSQLETYDNLMNGESGSFCQLNMGEGKTQVIIPLMILDIIYSKKGYLPRVNLLSSLYEETRQNFFHFLSASGFQLPGFEIPFTRNVELNMQNINAMGDLMNSFERRAYILINRESRLSEVLRFYETAEKDDKISLYKTPLLNYKIFDIFDEVDALMTPKKSYIFSVGNQKELPSADIRLEILRLSIEVFLTKLFKWSLDNRIVITDETEQDAIKQIQRGEYPDGLRLIINNASKDKLKQLRKLIAKQILYDSSRHEYSFIKRLEKPEIENLIEYITEEEAVAKKLISNKILKASLDQIYVLRGAFAYGIFQHCLSMRNGVDFGPPNQEHKKRIAVPYEAADIPSKTSQYEHPDVSALLSYEAFYTKGLNFSQFIQALKALLNMTATSKSIEYKQWMEVMSDEDQQKFQIKHANQINYNSKAHKDLLFTTFRKNRKTVAFWLTKCIFPRDLIQYQKSICSSAFDIADVENAIGFSGTKDNRWLYSDKMHWKPCQSPIIKGTDGGMIYSIMEYTKQVCLIEENQKLLWQRFIDMTLMKKASCFIDAGAICVGKSLKNEIIPWIAEHAEFDKKKYPGISFCNEDGEWEVYDTEAKFYISRGTTIPDYQTFVVFDEARTRGADIKMGKNITAVLSLGPKMSKDKLMQAAGRLRMLGRNQKLIIMGTHEVFSFLPTFTQQVIEINKLTQKAQIKNLIKLILAWCCVNSIEENENLLIQYAKLGWKYVYSKVEMKPFYQDLYNELEDMYQSSLQIKSVSQINQGLANQKSQVIKNHLTGKHICMILKKYGNSVYQQSGTLDDVCERQIEAEKEKIEENEDRLYSLLPICETDKEQLVSEVPRTPYKFSQSFKMTTNFIETTKKDPSNVKQSHLITQQKELPECYFVKMKKNELVLISLRQASKFIKDNIIGEGKSFHTIKMLQDLKIDDSLIIKNNLQSPLVQAKFLSGQENFSEEEQKILEKMFLRSLEDMNAKSDKNIFMNLLSLVLKRRRVMYKKFVGSSLEKMIIILENQYFPDQMKEAATKTTPP